MGLQSLLTEELLDTPEAVEKLAQDISAVFAREWLRHSKAYNLTPKSKRWWNDECQTAYDEYQWDNSPETRSAFRKATKAAKREFFDDRIKDISETNMRPWDLMDWVKERKNPPCEAIQYNGQPCHELSKLWEALHGIYNAANDREVDPSFLDELPNEPVRE